MTLQKASALSSHFLIAMPGMDDPNFDGTLVLIAEHSKQGATGLVVNRPIGMRLESLFDGINLSLPGPQADQPVLYGGPVHDDRGFVLHRPDGRWKSTISINSNLSLTSSRDILEALAAGVGPDQWLVTVGCSQWGPGQLERELADNVWLTVEADAQVIFNTPTEQRLARSFSLLGFDPTHLSGVAGHA
ncbi:MAG: YqgE/AlgH family protein [Burkholderiaceae bacterium]